MKKATLYTIPGCPGCADAKKEIAKRKKAGTCCYDFKIVNANKLKNPPKNLSEVPAVKVDGKIKDFWKVINKCKVGK